jgi:hypothetical protein
MTKTIGGVHTGPFLLFFFIFLKIGKKMDKTKNLEKFKDRLEDIPPGCLLIHERARLKKQKPAF